MNRSDPLERTNLSTKALEFLLDLHDASQDESIGTQDESIQTLCVVAEQLRPGATVGGSIIDGRSATFDRVVFPSLPASHFSTLRHIPIGPPTLELAHRRCVRKDSSSAQTLRPTPVLTTAGVVYTSALASTRCNPLPYSATKGRRLARSLWRSGSHGLPSTWRSRLSACMPCGPFFKNRHAISPGSARSNLAWHETSALLSCTVIVCLSRPA